MKWVGHPRGGIRRDLHIHKLKMPFLTLPRWCDVPEQTRHQRGSVSANVNMLEVEHVANMKVWIPWDFFHQSTALWLKSPKTATRRNSRPKSNRSYKLWTPYSLLSTITLTDSPVPLSRRTRKRCKWAWLLLKQYCKNGAAAQINVQPRSGNQEYHLLQHLPPPVDLLW